MTYEQLDLKIEDRIAVLTIAREKKLNALDSATIQELHQAFSALDADKEVRVIVLTGQGQKAFVAGADIAEFSSFNQQQGEALSRSGHEKLFAFVENLNTPVIAAINGYALGGGLELALSCHMRMASENAKMGLPEVTLGLIPGYGGTRRLGQIIGKGRTHQMVASGQMISAEKALQWGLVNEVYSQEELISKATELAMKIASNAPIAVSHSIKAINAQYSNSVASFETEIQLFGACFATNDFKEGTSAFLEKRKPDFKGD
jgi:enoyl-CoA hydratase